MYRSQGSEEDMLLFLLIRVTGHGGGNAHWALHLPPTFPLPGTHSRPEFRPCSSPSKDKLESLSIFTCQASRTRGERTHCSRSQTLDRWTPVNADWQHLPKAAIVWPGTFFHFGSMRGWGAGQPAVWLTDMWEQRGGSFSQHVPVLLSS